MFSFLDFLLFKMNQPTEKNFKIKYRSKSVDALLSNRNELSKTNFNKVNDNIKAFDEYTTRGAYDVDNLNANGVKKEIAEEVTDHNFVNFKPNRKGYFTKRITICLYLK